MTPYGIPEPLWHVVSDLIIGVLIAAFLLGWAAVQQQEDADDSLMPALPLPPELWLMSILAIVLWWKLILLFMLAAVVSLSRR